MSSRNTYNILTSNTNNFTDISLNSVSSNININNDVEEENDKFSTDSSFNNLHELNYISYKNKIKKYQINNDEIITCIINSTLYFSIACYDSDNTGNYSLKEHINMLNNTISIMNSASKHEENDLNLPISISLLDLINEFINILLSTLENNSNNVNKIVFSGHSRGGVLVKILIEYLLINKIYYNNSHTIFATNETIMLDNNLESNIEYNENNYKKYFLSSFFNNKKLKEKTKLIINFNENNKNITNNSYKYIIKVYTFGAPRISNIKPNYDIISYEHRGDFVVTYSQNPFLLLKRNLIGI